MRAFVTGISGQDGSFLAELLLSKGYEVFGLKRRTSTSNTKRIDHLLRDGSLKLVDGDMCDSSSLTKALKEVQPDEIYNLAAQSFVHSSFIQPELTGEVTAMGVTRLLEAMRCFSPKARFYQASTSEMFGGFAPPQSESTPFHPRSPYGVAKLYAHWLTINYRESHKLWACAGLCFNHESFRRGSEFVTQKIAQGAAACAAGVLSKLRLGNLEARRDWGHAADFVRAMWLMLQQEEPDEYVIGTGEEHSVREFAELAFRRVGLDYKEFVEVDERHYRPAEVNVLRADYSKARRVLGWEPKMSFEALVNEMVDHAMGHPGEWR